MTPTHNLHIPQHCSLQHHVRLYTQRGYGIISVKDIWETQTILSLTQLKKTYSSYGFSKIYETTGNSTGFWQLSARKYKIFSVQNTKNHFRSEILQEWCPFQMLPTYLLNKHIKMRWSENEKMANVNSYF